MPEGTPASPSPLPPRGCLLGFDFGLARIGVATGELETGLANPLTTLATESRDARFGAISDLIETWQPIALVVGLPHPGEHTFAPRCRRFANQLNGRFRLPVYLVDEQFSSVEANRSLTAAGVRNWQARKAKLDAVAAQLILQHFLDTRHAVP